MKKVYFILLTFLVFSVTVNAQEVKKGEVGSWNIGVGIPNTIVQGDLASSHESGSLINPGYYLYMTKMFSPVFGLEIKGQYLDLIGGADEFADTTENIAYNNVGKTYFEGDTFGGEANLRINISALVNKERTNAFIFSTYLGFGSHYYNSEAYKYSEGGIIGDSYSPETHLKRKSSYYTGGLGLQYYLGRKVNLELRQTFNVNEEDDLDAVVSDKSSNDYFHTTHLGLVFKVGDEKRLDSDKDGVYDDEDACPDLAGIVENNGCPLDTDKDGVYDIYDDCVDLPGVEENKGCPKDTDEDGIYDIDDTCPNLFGIVENQGCPKDTDKDGVYDIDDTCPLIPGVEENNGCPKDTDKDGIYDVDDTCPEVPGTEENKGCPEKAKFDYQSETITLKDGKKARIIETVYYDINKATIRSVGKENLTIAAKKMRENPDMKFIISGNTDSGGNRAYNLKLSNRRAEGVKKFLISKGIDESRLTVIGYGYENPQYIENSLDAKQLNRRVEVLVETDGENGIGEGPKSLTQHKHTVKLGETLYSIANKYGITISEIKEWNPSIKGDSISKGDELIVVKQGDSTSVTPKENKYQYHTVSDGDTLFYISQKYGVSVDEIKTWNNLTSNTISRGTKLVIKK